MNLLRRIFLGDPYQSGARILTDDEILVILREEIEEKSTMSPYAKTVGYVLRSSNKGTANRKGYKSKHLTKKRS